MPNKIHIKWFYAIGIGFLIAAIVAFNFDSYWVAAIPLVPIVGYFIFFKAELVLYFLAFATPLSVPVDDIGGGFGLSLPTEPIIVLLFVLILIKWVAGKGFNKQLFKEPLTIIILLDIAWMLVTTSTSSMVEVSLKYTLSRIWFVSVFYIGLVHLFRNKRAIRIFLSAFVCAAAILAAYTLFSHAQHSFTRYYAYTAMRPFLPDHGMYAALLSFAILPCIVYAIWADKLGGNLTQRLIAIGMTGVLALGLVFSFTRASWLSVVIALILMGLLLLRIRFKTLVGTSIVVVVVFVTFSGAILSEMSRNKSESDDDIFTHLSSMTNVSSDPSNLERLNRWSCAYRMFLDKPVLGFGPGTFTYQYGPYQLPHEMSIISTSSGNIGGVHSEYLRPLSESGLVGFLFYVVFVLIAVKQGFAVYFKSKQAEIRLIAMAAMLGLVTYFIHGMLNNYSDFDKIAVPLWSFAAVLTALKIYHIPKDDAVEKT
jgi:putative inorganic carbon (hco3(-)) transporter